MERACLKVQRRGFRANESFRMPSKFARNRLEAFSDGVLAIIITIMVLELKAPRGGADLAELRPLAPVFLSYVLSFVYVGIYWNNHHHLMHSVERVTGSILWANLHLLFWLSLVPFVTAWTGANDFAPVPTAMYGVVLLASAVAYFVLQAAIVRVHGQESVLARAIGRDFKGRLSLVMYVTAIGLATVNVWAANALYVGVALVWLVPDRRIERAIAQESLDAERKAGRESQPAGIKTPTAGRATSGGES